MAKRKGTIKQTKIETLEMSITPDYVPHWDTSAALREFLQNALDAQTTGSPIELSEADGKTTMINWGADLPLKTLLLGATTKADNDEEIGQFGEGYKLACLVLARQDIEIEISSPQGTIYPFITFSNKYQSDILAFNWNKELRFLGGVQISFKKSQVPLNWLKSLVLLDAPHDIRILKDKPGKVYGGGLHLNIETNESGKLEDNFHWGYNLHPRDLEMDRDRRMVSRYSLKRALFRCLEENEPPASIYQALKKPYPEFKDILSYDVEHETKKALFIIFRELHGEKAIAIDSSTDEEYINLIERAGLTPIMIKSRTLFVILNDRQHSKEYIVQLVKNRGIDYEEYNPTHDEQERFRRAIDVLRKINDKEYISTLSKLDATLIQTVLFTDPDILGSWNPETGTLSISAKCLSTVGELLLLITHEIVHSEYQNHGDRFQQAVDNIIIKVFDYILEKGE